MTTEEKLKLEIKRAKAKLTRLKNRGQESTGDFEYWQSRLRQAEHDRYNLTITKLAANYGPVFVGKVIQASGEIHIKATNEHGDFIKFIDQKIIPEDVKEKIGVVADYRKNTPPCRRCGATGTQLHHWAPRHLFKDADKWPVDYLCPACHRRWHKRIQDHWRGNGNGH